MSALGAWIARLVDLRRGEAIPVARACAALLSMPAMSCGARVHRCGIRT